MADLFESRSLLYHSCRQSHGSTASHSSCSRPSCLARSLSPGRNGLLQVEGRSIHSRQPSTCDMPGVVWASPRRKLSCILISHWQTQQQEPLLVKLIVVLANCHDGSVYDGWLVDDTTTM